MLDILQVLSPLRNELKSTNYRRLSLIVVAALSMVGRVTMLSISRWTEKGGSYRTVERFSGELLRWVRLNYIISKPFLCDVDDTLLISADESIVTKSGKESFGLGRFFSSTHGSPVPSLCFLCVSLTSVKRRHSFPIMMKQVDRSVMSGCSKYKGRKSVDKTDTSTKKTGKKGRPKGSKNINRRDVQLSKYLTFMQSCVNEVKAVVDKSMPLAYYVFDGELGHNFGVQMTRQIGLHLISKLRCNSKLYLPWDGEYSGKGRPRVYGDRLHPESIPEQYLKSTVVKDGIRTEHFQIAARHRNFPDALNVVIIRKKNLSNAKVGHVILFSSDINLSWDKLVDYYQLRFQIEFNFRDAKQFWGLEDFMVIKETKIHNSANLATFMVNLSYAMLEKDKGKNALSVHDLKMWFLAQKQVLQVLKTCSENTNDVFIQELIRKISMKTMVNAKDMVS